LHRIELFGHPILKSDAADVQIELLVQKPQMRSQVELLSEENIVVSVTLVLVDR